MVSHLVSTTAFESDALFDTTRLLCRNKIVTIFSSGFYGRDAQVTMKVTSPEYIAFLYKYLSNLFKVKNITS